jgi:hypothetical protein
MNRLPALSLLLAMAWLAAPAAAQPDRAEALAKAKAKFEQDVSKAEDALIAGMDKALAKASNKTAAEKLTYERELFVNQRIVPTLVPAGAYVKQRSQATAALEAAYLPAIRDLRKATKDEEAAALESALGDLLKAARGYGLALPDLARRPPLVIENKATGLVLEPDSKNAGHLALVPKQGKRRPAQCWYIDRDPKGYVFVNASTGRAICLYGSSTVNGVPVTPLSTGKIDPQKDVPERSLFQLTESGREVLISPGPKGEAGDRVLAASEKKQKGVTVHEPWPEKKGRRPAPNQLWVISEAK